MKKIRTQIGLFAIFSFNFLQKKAGIHLRKMILKITGHKIGNESYIHGNVDFTWIGKFSLGCRSTVNKGSMIDNRGGVFVGSGVMIGHNVRIYTGGHHFNDPDFKTFYKKVSINNYSVLYPNSIILPGCDLPLGCVVMPGSVVYPGDYPKGAVLQGNPAKVVSIRKEIYSDGFSYGFYFANS